MSIFESDSKVQFGKSIPTPSGMLPQEAKFVKASVPYGSKCHLYWYGRAGVAGYHIFRSNSVSYIDAYNMGKFYSGGYKDVIQHFVVGSNVSEVIDGYKQGGSSVCYWVLAQDTQGNITHVKDLQVMRAGHDSQIQDTFLMSPETRYIERPKAAPVPVDQGYRELKFVQYNQPVIFQIEKKSSNPDHYTFALGPVVPDPKFGDALWDDKVLPGCPLQVFTLPGILEGFQTRASASGNTVHVAVLAFEADGSSYQPEVIQVVKPPSVITEIG